MKWFQTTAIRVHSVPMPIIPHSNLPSISTPPANLDIFSIHIRNTLLLVEVKLVARVKMFQQARRLAVNLCVVWLFVSFFGEVEMMI